MTLAQEKGASKNIREQQPWFFFLTAGSIKYDEVERNEIDGDNYPGLYIDSCANFNMFGYSFTDIPYVVCVFVNEVSHRVIRIRTQTTTVLNVLLQRMVAFVYERIIDLFDQIRVFH